MKDELSNFKKKKLMIVSSQEKRNGRNLSRRDLSVNKLPT